MPAADAQPPAAPPAEDDAWPAWEDAWAQALYGRAGFYRTPEGPAGHFRTACHAAPQDVARVVLALAAEGGCTSVVDVGAGRGGLAAALQVGPGPRVGVHAVDVVERPPSLPAPVGWTRAEPHVPGPADAVRRALSGASAGPCS
ncbi:MAG: hypothetical protein U0Q15_06185 [Kineosporiaceae bacterium]